MLIPDRNAHIKITNVGRYENMLIYTGKSASEKKNVIICRNNKYSFKDVSKHWHSYYEIELVVDGEGTHIINGKEYHETSGDAFIMRLDDYHEFKLDKRGFHAVVDVPINQMPIEIDELLSHVKGDIFIHLEKEEFNRAYDIYKLIDRTGADDDILTQMQKKYYTGALILFILSHLGENISQSYSGTNQRLREIIIYINKNIQDELSVSEIANVFHISSAYLSTFFKKMTGLSLSDYIRKIRLELAVEMLLNTDKSILEICDEIGFNSGTTFSRSFKREYGVTPSEMRRKSK